MIQDWNVGYRDPARVIAPDVGDAAALALLDELAKPRIYGVFDANGHCVDVTEDPHYAVYLGAMLVFTVKPWRRYQAPARFFRMERVNAGHYRKLFEITESRSALTLQRDRE